MEQLNAYALCIQADSGQLVPVISGQCNHIGLYKLVMQLSDFRQLVPQLMLVINGHVVSHVDFTSEGMCLKGQPLAGEV